MAAAPSQFRMCSSNADDITCWGSELMIFVIQAFRRASSVARETPSTRLVHRKSNNALMGW